jgi:nicotinate-nucleotide adenylyltransferase
MISESINHTEGAPPMKKAIYGGTFDPVHYGHLRVAEEVRDRVVFMPASINPLKEDERSASANARLELIGLAIEGNPAFELSDMEIRRGGLSYTVETLREFKAAEDDDLSLIIGSDSFNDIRMWCEFEEIFRLANLIVVPRPGVPAKKLAEALPVELARNFWYDASRGCYLSSFGTTVSYPGTTLMYVSSTEIRRMVSKGLSIRYLLPEAVREYILREGLYR